MSCINKNIYRLLLLAVFFTCKVSICLATTDPPLTKLLKGSLDSVHINAVSSNVDIKYFSLTTAQKQSTVTHVINNLVGVGIEEENTMYIPGNFSVTVVLQITKHGEDNAITETLNKSFTINYDTASGAKYNSLNYYAFTWAYAVDVKIISIDSGNITWPVSKVLKIENTLAAHRDYPFYCSIGVTNLQLQHDVVNDELTASWSPDIDNPNPGQTEYDLEWAWVDETALENYMNGNDYLTDIIFENNASRVSITGSQYNIPLLYDDSGRIFVRVRPIQVKDDGQRIEGAWTWGANGNTQPPVFYTYLDGHEPLLNWQASTSYAEEGKRKSVVQYFDGSLRNRQTVTKDNSSNTTVVAESFYDYQGRAVIQVLPAPTLSNAIGYAHNFNKAVNENGYPKWVYDKLDPGASVCSNPAKGFETTTGTANYYSPSNPLVAQGVNKYIPDATAGDPQQAYAYTETRLSPDGRVASQGGVGINYQLGSGHETKYFYESPAQPELDALFGTDAGVASHYFKNIVEDANGQFSVAYVDMHGRTVATALAGGTPLNTDGTPKLEALASQGQVPIVRQLIDNETNIIVGNSIISSKPFVSLSDNVLYSFDYTLSPKQLSLFNCDNTAICYDCLYDLTITITSDCISQPGFTPLTHTTKNFSLGQYLTQCHSNGDASQGFHEQYNNISLPKGSYTVTKTLTLNSQAQRAYRDIFIGHDTCRKFNDFYDYELQLLQDASTCNITCESCNLALGSPADFITRYKQQAGIDVNATLDPQLVLQLTASYNESKANCESLCNTNADGMDIIRSIEAMMLQDVTPPYGQYAKPEESTRNYNIFKVNDPTNNSAAALAVFPHNDGKADYLRPVKHDVATSTSTATYNRYYDEFGQPDNSINLLGQSAYFPTVDEFVTQFKTDWANQLLPHHPEYRKLMITKQQLVNTYKFEADMQKDTTWLMAKLDGFISNLLNLDPYYFVRPDDKTAMNNKIYSYYPLQNSTSCTPHTVSTEDFIGMWQIALGSVFCRNIPDNSNPLNPPCDMNLFNDINNRAGCLFAELRMPPANHPIRPNSCETDWDMAWKVFRNMYLAERRKFISGYLNSAAPVFPDNYPNNSLPPYKRRFIDYANPNTLSQNPDAGTIGGIIDNLNNGGNISNGVQQVGVLALDQYDRTCRGYAATWITQLQACPQVGIMSAADKQWLTDRLVAICKAGSDEGHVLGSSSIKPGNPAVAINSNEAYADFPGVIMKYLSTRITPSITHPYTLECFPWMITVPLPYDRQPAIANSYVLDKPSDCECQRLSDLHMQMQEAINNGSFAGTFSEYMEYRHGTYISEENLDILLALCAGTYDCRMLAAPLSLPPALQCHGSSQPAQTCISCQEYEAVRASFFQDFAQTAPILQPQTAAEVDLNIAFARYANYKTGFVKRWSEYVAFQNTCNATTSTISCADLSAALHDFYLTPQYLQNTVGAGCIQAFVNYFNTRFNVVYTFQVWLLKFQECGTVLDACTPKINCDNFNSLVDGFYNLHGVQVYKNASCQSLFVTYVNQQLSSSYTYAELELVYAYTCKNNCGLNICDFPNHFLLTRVYNDFIADYNGHPWDIPDCQGTFVTYFNNYFGIVIPMDYEQVANLYNSVGEVQNCVPDIRKLCIPPYSCEQIMRIYEAFYSSHQPISELPDCQQVFADYFNGIMATHYTYAELLDLYLHICKAPLSLCGNATSCTDIIAFVSAYRATHAPSTGPDCQASFLLAFNTHFGTNYTSFDDLRARYLQCRFNLNLCDNDRSVESTATGRSVTSFLATFLTEIPDPATQAGSDCENLFAAKFNEQFGSAYSFEQIEDYYYEQAGVVLDVCQTRCSRLTDFITAYNAKYEGLKLPAIARQDLFAFAYSDAFINGRGTRGYGTKMQLKSDSVYGAQSLTDPDPRNAGPLVNYEDLLTSMEACSVTGSLNFYPTVTISLYDPQVLLSLKQVFYDLHPAGLPLDCEGEFAGWFNRVMQTTYAYSELFDLYNNTCGNNAGYICSAPNGADPGGEVTVKGAGTVLNSGLANLPPLLCGLSEATSQPVGIDDSPCNDLPAIAYNTTLIKYQLYLDSLRNAFDIAYHNKCMGAKDLESFTVTYQTSEYHYTLYYYDQAGNLVKTVPPAGVQRFTTTTDLDLVKSKRADALINGPTASNQKTPVHTLVTEYRYNTLNQVVQQNTPDAGTSKFWYDRLGRLVISQNAKQQITNKYSFTEYDVLGRIILVGQKPQATAMTTTKSRDPQQLDDWLNTTQDKEQITRTVYDLNYYAGEQPSVLDPVLNQQNLRNRVSYTSVFNVEPSGTSSAKWFSIHNAATYYSYDIHGNVDVLVQDYNEGYMKYKDPTLTGTAQTALANLSGNRWKKIVYDYDLISGKVNKVTYQPDYFDAATNALIRPDDQFFHRYSYDAENRLTDVETSFDQLVWEHDARYSYYKHGPLARTILGQDQVQGIDYAYTLQGWLKGVNSTSVNQGILEIGGDGKIGGANSNIARDAYGYSLNYFAGDYKPIGGTSANPFAGNTFSMTNIDGNKTANELFNGNIAAMMVNIPKLGDAQSYGYKYDQLNRIVSMDAFTGLNNTTNSFTAIAAANYKERITYDPNGNIVTYKRNADAVRGLMDNMNYSYKPGTNQLDKVEDLATDAAASDYDKYNDIKMGQTNANYQYDAIGNLVSDFSEGITNIQWTVYGKIAQIEKTVGTVNTVIKYSYDAIGNRISKDVNGKITYYVRDASGNTMSVYTKDASINNGHLTQSELHLYGNSRLGILNTNTDMSLATGSTGISIFIRGNKFFELSNHLGNVLVTVSDKKIPHSTNGTTIDWYNADVITANDYYPFGMAMPGRKFQNASVSANYKYGFNGKEKDKDMDGDNYDYGFRIYNQRIGRFLSTDPLSVTYPWYTPYQFAGNKPIVAIDLDGLEEYIVTNYYDKNNKLIETTISVTTNTKTGKRENLHLKKDDGSFITDQNVLIRNVSYDGSTSYSSQSELNKSQKNIVEKAIRNLYKPKGYIYFGNDPDDPNDDTDGDYLESERHDLNSKSFITSEYNSNAILKRLPVKPKITAPKSITPKVPIIIAPTTQKITSKLTFEGNSRHFDVDPESEIDKIVSMVKDSKVINYSITVFGNIDGDGSYGFDDWDIKLRLETVYSNYGELALARANTIKKALVDRGLDPSKITTALGSPNKGKTANYEITTTKTP
ncbi:MAG: RHS repeat-associated core domain-containing protein [Ferruginibacter sp.]